MGNREKEGILEGGEQYQQRGGANLPIHKGRSVKGNKENKQWETFRWYDRIALQFLKMGGKIMVKCLQLLISVCMERGRYPQEWRVFYLLRGERCN